MTSSNASADPWSTRTKLSLGCGTDIRLDHVNLDIVALPGVDVVHDLRILPLPFSDERFTEIRCDSILEHLDYIPLVGELHRILRIGGRLLVVVPHFSASSAYEDPQHVKMFASQTLAFFTRRHSRSYYLDFAFDRVEKTRIEFTKSTSYPWNYVIEPLVNLSDMSRRFYENTPLRVFPAVSIRTTLVK